MSAAVISAAGMVTAVGLDWASSCAALRARLDGFQETRFMGHDGAFLVGAPVPLPRAWEGAKRMAHLAAGAMHDLAARAPELDGTANLILLLAEEGRPGRSDIAPAKLVEALAEYAGFRPRGEVQVLREGRPGGMIALAEATARIRRSGHPTVILGVDSYLNARSIVHYMAERRLLSRQVSDGFIPGEGAAAILVSQGRTGLVLRGTGVAQEPAALTNVAPDGLPALPFRCEGMSKAYGAALAEAGYRHDHIRLKLGDLIGEGYWFNQTAIAMHRTQRERSPVRPIWALGASLGNVGAAAVPILLGWALAARDRGYAPAGPILVEASADDGLCGAAVLEAA